MQRRIAAVAKERRDDGPAVPRKPSVARSEAGTSPGEYDPYFAERPPTKPQSGQTPASRNPKAAASQSPLEGARRVTAGPGDTVYALSRRHSVSPKAIIRENNLKPPYKLRVGQSVMLPRSRFHVVKSGETLYGISRTYGLDRYELARANGLRDPYRLTVGQHLQLDGRVALARPAPAAREPEPGGRFPEPPRKIVPGDYDLASVRPPRKNQSGATTAQVRPVERVARRTAPADRSVVPKPPAKSGKGFGWPVSGKVVSSFGPKESGRHNDGINISAPAGTPFRAAENGVVAYAGNELAGFGNLLLIKHQGGWVTAYAHAEQLNVRRGEKVSRGQVIGRVGRSGSVSRPQLHFEIRKGRQAVNPKKHLKSG